MTDCILAKRDAAATDRLSNAGARASAFLAALAEQPGQVQSSVQSIITVEVRVRGVNHEKLYSFR